MSPQDFIAAARVPPALQPQTFGLWKIARRGAPPKLYSLANGLGLEWVGFPDYTILFRVTEATMHLDGVVVMEDSARELSKHLPIWLAARGRVLITGLGLGCVVRGLLASTAVEHIDVVEIDADILRIVGAEFVGNPRVSLHLGDAITFEWPAGTRWDCAWHDLWHERDADLHLMHCKLLHRHRDECGPQGAWAFPRQIARIWRTPLLGKKSGRPA